MKKQIISIALLLAGAAGTLTSCENWLDVTSGSEIRAEDHFKNTEGFRQALIGCYLGMTDQTLYGKDMSWLVPEMLGQQFEPYSIGVAASSREHYLPGFHHVADISDFQRHICVLLNQEYRNAICIHSLDDREYVLYDKRRKAKRWLIHHHKLRL